MTAVTYSNCLQLYIIECSKITWCHTWFKMLTAIHYWMLSRRGDEPVVVSNEIGGHRLECRRKLTCSDIQERQDTCDKLPSPPHKTHRISDLRCCVVRATAMMYPYYGRPIMTALWGGVKLSSRLANVCRITVLERIPWSTSACMFASRNYLDNVKYFLWVFSCQNWLFVHETHSCHTFVFAIAPDLHPAVRS